ncbi:uncharacterized protein DDB_G0283697-like [Centruroides sculpturatus]|uniref:uncharacterized protein DDB_G0283697-like n=1 Tax=Centruroides sculpturatus TaxID=218467 RepID=UPI000C6E5AED|nr:uncharacterized protein DDB_G0283697-like [Centruroides sculpturatus]
MKYKMFVALLLLSGFAIEIESATICLTVHICRNGICSSVCREIPERKFEENETIGENKNEYEANEDVDSEDKISRNLNDDFKNKSENTQEEPRNFDDFLESDAWENESFMKKRMSDKDSVREIGESSEDEEEAVKRELIREEMENEFRELLESDEAGNEIREVIKDMEKENVVRELFDENQFDVRELDEDEEEENEARSLDDSEEKYEVREMEDEDDEDEARSLDDSEEKYEVRELEDDEDEEYSKREFDESENYEMRQLIEDEEKEDENEKRDLFDEEEEK